MTKRNLSITIAIGFIALFGIILVQIHWINTAYTQNKIRFEQNLNKALNQIVIELSQQENIFFDFDSHEDIQFISGNPSIIHFDNASGKKLQWLHESEKEEIVRIKAGEQKKKEALKKIIANNQNNRKIIIRSNDSNIEMIQEFHLDSLTEQIETEMELKASAISIIKKDSLLKKYETRIDSVRKMLDYNEFTIASEKEELNNTMVELFMNIKSVTRPFAKRIPIDKLQNSIEKAIKQYNLPKSYAFAIAIQSADSILFKTDNFNIKDISQAHTIRLFPHSLVSRPEHLYINFPEANPLFKQMLWPIILAFIFTLLLFGSLLIIINNLLHHKKLSAIKTDFINNMTHEFKTPLATIQLATDSVMTEQILKQPKRIGYYMSLIKGENKRMNALVERILQMAQLEKKSFSLVKTEVNMHQLIDAVAENAQLQIEQADGEIKLNLKAEQAILQIDEMHLTNVLFNLIDNAVKYSTGNLLVEISTVIKNGQFVIIIKDNGQGMSKETVAHIFDKFFRLTKGNIHTVKGYGLGLSYVKAIVDKHNGQIHVFSEPEIGSHFEISLPFKH
ncbi:MAG: HAMP domain-containing sensor histidine kinase [Bacteroidales bacterium]|jgi:two-component system phosphate regulon sensor histidine kinase PhoR|nr:HAMP domain-containing sensor histidine kinase [Bacteroidales bacterium]